MIAKEIIQSMNSALRTLLVTSLIAGVALAVLSTPTVWAQTPDGGFNPGADNRILSLVVQPDGKILVGGWFHTLAGVARSHIGRLNPNGTLDIAFDPGTVDDPVEAAIVYALAVQADGKILLGGNFRTIEVDSVSTTRNYIARLNSDGTLDTTFDPGADDGVDDDVLVLAVQPDGKIVVGGVFTTLAGSASSHVGRLNSNGTLDPSFTPPVVNNNVIALALQADGKILLGGFFTSLAGNTCSYIGRLNSNGTFDTCLNSGANSLIKTLAVQADGKILVGGDFTTLAGSECKRIGRLNPNGTLDTCFNGGASEHFINTLAVQADGKILVGGGFHTLGGSACNLIGRLNPDGTFDTCFNSGVVSNFVDGLALQADGKVLVGGDFTQIGGVTRNYIARLSNNIATVQNLSFTSSTVTWTRSGASPEVRHVTFEQSPDNVTYTLLGAGTRITDGWQLSGLTLPLNLDLFIRARGYYATGVNNGSESDGRGDHRTKDSLSSAHFAVMRK